MLKFNELIDHLKRFKTCYIVEKTGLSRSCIEKILYGVGKNPKYTTALALHDFIKNENKI